MRSYGSLESDESELTFGITRCGFEYVWQNFLVAAG